MEGENGLVKFDRTGELINAVNTFANISLHDAPKQNSGNTLKLLAIKQWISLNSL